MAPKSPSKASPTELDVNGGSRRRGETPPPRPSLRGNRGEDKDRQSWEELKKKKNKEMMQRLLRLGAQVVTVAILLAVGYVGVQAIDKLALRWAASPGYVIVGSSKGRSCPFWDISCHASKGGPLLFEARTCHVYGVDLAYLLAMPLSISGKVAYYAFFPFICVVSGMFWIYSTYSAILSYIWGILLFIPLMLFSYIWGAVCKVASFIWRVLQIGLIKKKMYLVLVACWEKIKQVMPICFAVYACLALLDRAKKGPKLVTVGIAVFLSLCFYAVFKLGLYVIWFNLLELSACPLQFQYGAFEGAKESLTYWKAVATFSFV